jgi:hypothetical protein
MALRLFSKISIMSNCEQTKYTAPVSFLYFDADRDADHRARMCS